MSGPIDQSEPQSSGETEAIARHLRIERQARNWSLAELAMHSGVSKATISKIERHEASPTAAVLGRLAAAFGVTLARFLLKAESRGERLSRRADQAIWVDPDTAYRRRQVFAREDLPLDLAEIEFPAGRRVSFPRSAIGSGAHLIWVLSGTLTIVDGGDVVELFPGDCLALGATTDVTFENTTTETCRYAVVLIR